MPTLEYPQPLVAPHGPFTPIPDKDKSFEASMDTLRRRAAVIHMGAHDGEVNVANLRHAPSPLVGVTKLHVSVGGDHSTSFHNGRETAKADAIEACVFCPGEDPAVVSWKVRHEADVGRALLIVHGAGLDDPVSVKDVTGELQNGRGTAPKCTGGLPMDEAIEIQPGHALRFPDGVLTAEYSPYRFQILIVPKRGCTREAYPTVAWTFAEVLAHPTVQLAWGEAAHVPRAVQPGIVDPLGDNRFRDLEPALVRDLLQNGDIAADNELVLDTNVFSAVHIDADGRVPVPAKNNAEALEKLWGNGPRIPLEATVLVRKHDGSAASLPASKKALGRVCLLWDWEGSTDPLPDWLANPKPGYSSVARETLRRFLSRPVPSSPLLSWNCPVTFGGKRGDPARPVFPEQNDLTVWGNTVAAAAGARPWCAVSRTGTGLRRAKSTVLFQPAPIIGDRYRVVVYVTHDPAHVTPDSFPEMNVADTPSPPPVGLAPPTPPVVLSTQWRRTAAQKRAPRAATGVFEMKRRAKLRIVEYPAGAANAAVAALRAHYPEMLGLTLDIDQVTLQQAAVQQAFTGWFTTNAVNLNLVNLWAFDPTAPLGGEAFHTLAYAAFQNKVGDHLRFGKLYEAEVDAPPRLGACTNAAKKIFVWSSRAAGGGSPLATGIYGSADRATDILDTDVTHSGRFRRCCFSFTNSRDVDAPGNGNHQVTLRLTAAGQTQTVDVTWSSIRFGAPKVSTASRQEIRDALAALVGQLGAGPFDVGLTVLVEGKLANDTVVAWMQAVRAAAYEVFDEGYVLLDAAILRQRYFQTSWLGRVEALSQATYEAAVRKTISDLMIPLSDHARLVDQRAFPGVVYVALAPAANLGYFGIGGNNTGGRMGSGYVTEFPPAGFSQMLQLPFADVFEHEVGHVFYRNHAPTASFGFREYESEKGHTPHDTCLMNYDVEPHSMSFCAHCVLQSRGWKTLDQPVSRADAIQLLEAEILAEGNARAKAWKELRRARLEPIGSQKTATDERAAAETAWTQNNPDPAGAGNHALAGRQAATADHNASVTARQWIAQARATNAGNYGDAEGISLLRALIRAYLATDDYDAAWQLWQQLLGITNLPVDLWDEVSNPDPMLPGIVQQIEIAEGGNFLGAAVKQCLNLPAAPGYVDGQVATHADRIGRRVRLRITVTSPVRGIHWALLRHHQDGLFPHETVVTEPFHGADPAYTGAVWIKKSVLGRDGLIALDNTHLALEFDLPERGGRYKVAIAGAGRCVLSPEIKALRVMFLMTTTVQGNADANATPDGPAIADLNTAYSGIGVHFVHVGRATFPWPAGVYADDLDGNRKAAPFAQAAHALRVGNAASPFGPGLVTYQDHAAYMVQAIFVESLARWAGPKTQGGGPVAIDLPDNAPTHTYNVEGKAGIAAQVWEGSPADVDPDANGPAPEYAGRGHAKRWVLIATFTPSAGPHATQPQDVSLNRITAAASDVANFPGRLDRVTVDLSDFVVGNRIQGQLLVVLVVVKFVAGVDASAFAPARGMTILVTDSAAPVQRSALIHEIGHMLGLVANDGRHPSYYNIGSGPHCHAGFAKYGGGGMGDDHYRNQIANAACVMYHRVRENAPLLTFCDDCKIQAGASTWSRFQ